MKTLLISVLLALGASAATAQAPARGYWNLETNLTTRDFTVVRFYNDEHQLLREERLDNLCLDLSRGTPLCRRTAQLLNGTLAQVLLDPNSSESTSMLAVQLGQNRRIQRVYAVR
ncbi:hypothetical protein F0P96_02670 [Hymenobacter busanensis]|uniref:Uncharacterized protein n=1 Tax=Hymenobacter busanensis TaxID=2607656 RepID=A0A7L4ZV59_9BACT|nr:hypothetical protein [Hymenobacter busanensis]KAA9339539.1 hypothetical protein F0P96_02670 [Hymenobacter busanensis]QHJ06706.1 hypothetical protein GUY19_05085 [Hymenobacter busanensis]